MSTEQKLPEGATGVERFVVLPDHHDGKGKVYLVLALASAPGDEASTHWFARSKDNRLFRVGHEYEVPVRRYVGDDGKPRITLWFGLAKWVGTHDDAEKVAAWQAEQQAREATAAARSREKKLAADDSELLRLIEPLARAYAATPYPHRLGFEVWVLSVLRRKVWE